MSNNGQCVYKCFRASCKKRGLITTGGTYVSKPVISVGGINANSSASSKQPALADVRMPYWQLMSSLPERHLAWEYLKQYGCAEFCEENPDRIMYDPRRKRVVFLCKSTTGKYFCAASRKLSSTDKSPKWIITGPVEEGFTTVTGCVPPIPLVVVEDAASACSVSRRNRPSLALLGTSLTAAHLKYIKDNYPSVLIVLDRDAITLAVDMQKQLRSVGVSCKIGFPEDDLKYLSQAALRTFLKEYE